MLSRVIHVLFILISIVVISIIGYLIYLQITFYRIEDNKNINIENQQLSIMKKDEEYTILTHNIGFGAYSQDYSFFLDKGIMKDETVIQGKYARARSKESVLNNTNGLINLYDTVDADFYILQEVDTKSTRSFFVNQYQMITNNFTNYASTLAMDFHTKYIFYPLHEPHGASNSALLTLSKYKVDKSTRRQYPAITNIIGKFKDLDRCFLVNRIPIDGGKEFVLINSHMSAYDEGGVVRAAQLKILGYVLEEEYNKGNYVVVGGDFNNDLIGDKNLFISQQMKPKWIDTIDKSDIPEGFKIVKPINYKDVPTCRSAELPYIKGVNNVSIIDGFIVSNNIEAKAMNIDMEFMYSDHNPVKLTFKLKN